MLDGCLVLCISCGLDFEMWQSIAEGLGLSGLND